MIAVFKVDVATLDSLNFCYVARVIRKRDFNHSCRVGLIVHLLLEYWLRGYYEPPHRTGLEVFPHPALQEYILYVCLDRA
nr:hypothetical protein BSM_09810 [uncultured archaeon]